jgi:hypothetical protein
MRKKIAEDNISNIPIKEQLYYTCGFEKKILETSAN